jgi:anti-sigma regulatory factor (Ser/Thr protein kinase)
VRPSGPASTVPVCIEHRLPRGELAVARERALVAEALAGADPDHALALVTTELVANAVRHGRGRRIAFRLDADAERVVVEVENRCWSARPRRRLNSHTRGSGRGLALVAALSRSWGMSRSARGRARVWVELARAGEGAPAD